MKKILIMLALTLFVFSCGQKQEKSKKVESNKIIVGMELEYPPFETVGADGKPDGASVALAQELGKSLGKEVEIQNISYPGLIPALISGKIDFIISSMTINEERAKQVDFSIPYAESPLVMLVYKDSKIQKSSDLNNEDVTIAVKTGTIGALWAKANAPKAKINLFDKESQAVLDVSQGKSQVFIYDPLSVARHNEKYKETTRTIMTPLENVSGWGIAMRKNQPELKAKVDEFITKSKTGGTFDKIREKYLKEKKEEFEKTTGMKFFF